MAHTIRCDFCGAAITEFAYPHAVVELVHDWVGDGVERDGEHDYGDDHVPVNHGNLIRRQHSGKIVHACGSFAGVA